MVESMNENSLEMGAALSELRKKIEDERDLNPKDYLEKDVELLYSIAHKHYTIDQYDKAEPLFVRLVLARPEQIAYWKGLASCRQMQKDFSGALIAWGMCSVINPEDLSFHIYGAECLYYLNEMEEAAKAIAFVESKIDNNHPYFPKYIKIKRSLMGGEDGS